MKTYSYVFLGLSITSSWGNDHATTYRGLLKWLARRGHQVLFLERDLPFYARSRDLNEPLSTQSGQAAQIAIYRSFDELTARFSGAVRDADLVVVGSHVPDGVRVGAFVTEAARGKTAFYDLDTPVTLAKLARGETEYLSPELIPRYDLYLSFTGGLALELLERRYRARRARPLYGSVDAEDYYPEQERPRWDLGYLGAYSEDRQDGLRRLVVEPARRWPKGRFSIAGAQYPGRLSWPRNVDRREHIPLSEHRAFYNAQRFALNLVRRDPSLVGHSLSVGVFEAAACGVPLVSDECPGLDELFEPGREMLIARSSDEALLLLRELPERLRAEVGRRARLRVLEGHTAKHRALELERYTRELFEERELAVESVQ